MGQKLITPQELQATEIFQVLLQPLKIIPASGGPVLHMLRKDSALLQELKAGFGEVYFSEILPGYVKAWKRHKLQSQNFAVPWGSINLVLYDARPNSPTKAKMARFVLGRPDHYNLVHIPPGVWYGFCARNSAPALICNFADLPHDPEEAEKILPESPEAPCQWPDLI